MSKTTFAQLPNSLINLLGVFGGIEGVDKMLTAVGAGAACPAMGAVAVATVVLQAAMGYRQTKSDEELKDQVEFLISRAGSSGETEAKSRIAEIWRLDPAEIDENDTAEVVLSKGIQKALGAMPGEIDVFLEANQQQLVAKLNALLADNAGLRQTLEQHAQAIFAAPAELKPWMEQQFQSVVHDINRRSDNNTSKVLKKIEETRTPVTPGAVLGKLRDAINRRKEAALAEANKLATSGQREDRREAIDAEHELQTKQAEQIAAQFDELERSGLASSITQELERILAEEDPAAAFAFLERKRPGILERHRLQRELDRRERRPLLIGAELRASEGQTDLAVQEYDELYAVDADWPDLLWSYGNFCWQRGEYELRHGVQAKAIHLLERLPRIAARLAENLLQKPPRGPAPTGSNLLDPLCWGDALLLRGGPSDHETAFSQLTHAVKLAEELLGKNPDSGQAARDLSVSLEKLGDFLAQRGQTGDADNALAHYERSLQVREDLLGKNPGSGQAARDLSVSLNKLGDFLAQRGQTGDADNALAYFQRDLAIAEDLLGKNPGSGQAARDLSVSLIKLGDFLAQRGQTGDADNALAYFQRDLAIAEDLLGKNPGSGQAARDLSVSLIKLGDFLAQRGQTGDADNALAHYERSLQVREDLLGKNPGSGQAARDLSVSLNKLGDFLARRGQTGDADNALAHYERSLQVREDLLGKNPGSGQAARDLSVSLERLGDFLAQRGQTGDADNALAYFQRDLAIAEDLLGKNPDSGQAARDLSVSLIKLGDFLAQRGQTGDADNALAYFQRDLAIAEDLLGKNPGSGQAARDMVVSLHKLMMYRLSREEAEQAAPLMQRAYELLHDRIGKGYAFDAPVVAFYEQLVVMVSQAEE